MSPGRWDENERLLDKGFDPTGDDIPNSKDNSNADDDDDETTCKYCGSSSWVDISDEDADTYWCKKCGAKFYVESQSEDLKNEIEHFKIQQLKKQLWGSTKRKIITIISFIGLGVLVLRVIGFVVIILR